METDLATASEAIRSYLQTTGKDISTKGKALGEANKAVNQMVAMAKAGGMSPTTSSSTSTMPPPPTPRPECGPRR